VKEEPGFPLSGITTTLTGTFNAVGTYEVTVQYIEVGSNEVLGSKVITATVVAAS